MQHFKFVDGHLMAEPFMCSCGKEHSALPIREVIVKPGALQETVSVMNRLNLGKRGLVIADLNTYDVAGKQVVERLRGAGYTIDLSLFQTRNVIHPDEYAIGKVIFDLEPGTNFLLVVGSGCLTDITRVVGSRTGLPFVSVATAASMDGYASVVAAMLVNGIKKTIYSGPPVAIIADVDVIRKAPYPMTAAGFGDLIGKLNSRVDWQLARMIVGEFFCPEIMALVDDTVNSCIKQAAQIRTQSPEAIATLTEGLILAGIGMLAVGNSRPAAGAEHHLSHYWEMKSVLEHRPEHFHGKKVGVGTAVIAKFYERFLARDPAKVDLADIKRRKLTVEQWEEVIRQRFGAAADGVIALKKPTLLSWDDQQKMIAKIQACWKDIQALRPQVPTYDQVVAIQKEAGAAYLPEEVNVDREYLHETILYCKEARVQYTVLGAADALGWLEEIAEEVVSDYQ